MEDTRNLPKNEASVITLNDGQLRSYVAEVVRQSIEETLNGLLDAEADELCKAQRYERNIERVSTRAGHYERNFRTTSGNVRLRMPKFRPGA